MQNQQLQLKDELIYILRLLLVMVLLNDKGINYWKCIDSNADANNDKYEYRIEQGKGSFDFTTNDIQNPQQYSKVFRKDISWGGTLSSATKTVDTANWGRIFRVIINDIIMIFEYIKNPLQ